MVLTNWAVRPLTENGKFPPQVYGPQSDHLGPTVNEKFHQRIRAKTFFGPYER